ncbi:MAG: MFS transporter [Rhodospirillales bacterium]|nr:MFS transporter [Rhodospirillales bacterium]
MTAAIYSLPLFATPLDEGGYSELVIGINTVAQSIALLAVASFTPRILRRFSPAWPIIWGFAATVAFVLICPLYENAWYWLILRLLKGVSTGILWIDGETWINEIAAKKSRGQELAIYGAVLGLGTVVGNKIIAVAGFEGRLPFATLAVIVATSAIPWRWSPDARPAWRSTITSWGSRPSFARSVWHPSRSS